MHRFSPCPAAASTASLALLLVLASCGKDSTDVLGHAYVAPATLNLRRELAQKNSSAALLKHGERVDIIDVRRRFVKIRTSKGVEGWVDALQLLSPEQIKEIHREAQQALAMPSEGSATVYEALNIHLEPNRQSAAFAKIAEGASVAVLGHRIEPKSDTPLKPPNLIAERTQPTPHRLRKDREPRNANHFLLPLPEPPKPPSNWQELSSERIDGAESVADKKARADDEAAEKKAAQLQKPVVMEDWSLVRTRDNQCGWVLSRNLVMSIPDEVAQYAEGKRITSYFDLGAVQDEKKGVKHNWLWTTSSETESFDFDAWRVFLWNRRRHRYETSYRQHDVEGYFPVQVDPPDANAFGRGFELITKDDDAEFRRRTYLFDGVRVHLTGTEKYQPAGATHLSPAPIDTNRLQAVAPRQSWVRRRWSALKHSLGIHETPSGP